MVFIVSQVLIKIEHRVIFYNDLIAQMQLFRPSMIFARRYRHK